jgi:hypothetical protein
MAATASAAHVAPVVDTSAGKAHIATSSTVLPFLRLPRELRDQVRSVQATNTSSQVAEETGYKSKTM